MNVVEDGIKQGVLRGDIPLKLIRDMIFGGIEHQTWAYLRGGADFSVEDSAAGITDVVFRGIAVRPSSEPADINETLVRLEKIADTLEDGIKHLPRR